MWVYSWFHIYVVIVLVMILFGYALVLVRLWSDISPFVDENYSVCRFDLLSSYYISTFVVL